MRTADTRPRPAGRTQLDLMTAQLDAVDAWHRARRVADAAAESRSATRESRLDLSRRMSARRREQEALLTRAEQQLRDSGQVLAGRAPIRAVLAHRNAWLRDAVAERLTVAGVEVVGLFEDGADAAGTLVIEQPDLLLVEDRLPTLTGVEVVRRARKFSPLTLVGAQALDGAGVQALVDAGAQAVFTRRVPPAEIADQLLSRVRSSAREAVTVG